MLRYRYIASKYRYRIISISHQYRYRIQISISIIAQYRYRIRAIEYRLLGVTTSVINDWRKLNHLCDQTEWLFQPAVTRCCSSRVSNLTTVCCTWKTFIVSSFWQRLKDFIIPELSSQRYYNIASLCDIDIASISISHSNIAFKYQYRYRLSHNIDIAL